MDLKGKNVLLIGLAKTGISTIKLLDKLEAKITVNDIKTEEKLADILEELKDIKNAKMCIRDSLYRTRWYKCIWWSKTKTLYS